jgi:hypothetical protein
MLDWNKDAAHYMVGEAVHTIHTGCGIGVKSDEEPDFKYFYWHDRDKVTCRKCLSKIARLDELNSGQRGNIQRTGVDRRVQPDRRIEVASLFSDKQNGFD